MAIEIRQFRDEPEVSLGIERLIAESEAMHEWVPPLLQRDDAVMTAKDFLTAVFSNGSCYYAFDTENNQVIAVAGYHEMAKCTFLERGIITTRNEPYFHTVLTDSKYRGKGIGRQLINAMLDDARTKGFNSMLSRTWTTNEASKALLTKSGFKEFYIDSNCPDRPAGIGSVYFRYQIK